MSKVCFKPGDILTYSEYSGDARFVKLTRVTAKTAYGRFLTLRVVSDDGYGQNGSVMPNENEFDGAEFRIGMIHEDYIWSRKDRAFSSPWDGTPSLYYTD